MKLNITSGDRKHLVMNEIFQLCDVWNVNIYRVIQFTYEKNYEVNDKN